MSIEAMKQALEALEYKEQGIVSGEKDLTNRAITSLRQAIAEAEKQEPVAVMQLHTDGWDLVEGIDTDWLETLPFGTTLYTHPQPKREWVGLTDEDDIDWDGTGNLKQLVEAVEAKLKEKNT